MSIPTVYRPYRGRLRLRMPYRKDNRAWLKDRLGDRIRPEWVRGAGGREGWWEIARNHLQPLVEALVERWGAVDVTLIYSTTEQCDTRCQNARGDDCTCSCLGLNHGHGFAGQWTQVGDTTLVQREYTKVTRRMTG